MAKSKSTKSKEKVVKVTLVKSPIGFSERQKNTIKALGLRRMNQSVKHIDSPVLRGMLAKVNHLVQIDE